MDANNTPLDNSTGSIQDSFNEDILLPPRIKMGWLRALLYFVAFFVVTGVFQTFGVVFIALTNGIGMAAAIEQVMNNQNIYNLLPVQITTMLGTILVTLFFRKVIDRRSFKSLGWEIAGKQKDAAIGFVLGALLIAIGFVVLYSLGMLTVDSVQFLPGMMILYFLFMICVSINEELAVRGYMLPSLMESVGKYGALIITALVFSLMHALNPNITLISGINIFLAGILLGSYYIYKRNLWFPIMLHLSWNFFQGPVFGFEVSGHDLDGLVTQSIAGNELLTGGDFGFEGSLLLTVLQLLAIAWIHFKYVGDEEVKEVVREMV